MKAQLDKKIANHCDEPVPDSFLQPAAVKKIPEPTKAEIGHVLCGSKQMSNQTDFTYFPEYAVSYVVKSRTISDHFNQKYLDLTYPEVLKFCFQTKHHKLDHRAHLVLSFSRDFFSQRALTLLLFLACFLFLDCPLPSLKSLFKIRFILFLLVSKV